jgi:hypothetical protein
MIEVCNTRDKLNAPGVCDIAIGRPSILGNPFIIGRDGDRDSVISQYRDWLGRKLAEDDPVVMSELRRIALAAAGEVRLFCWCAPLACHGDVIKAVVQRYLDTGEWSVA